MSTALPPTVHVLHGHPLLSHSLARLRLASTVSRQFRALVAQIATIVAVEATRALPVVPVEGDGPLQGFTGNEVRDRIGVVPILRAGLGMVDACLNLLPDNTSVLHIGLFREKVSLQPVEYYSKLPAQPTVEQVFIVDPLIATGGTAIACVQMILDWGVPIERISFLAILGSQSGVRAVAHAYPALHLWIGEVDASLSDKGLILPGLGDTGDRLFDTVNH